MTSPQTYDIRTVVVPHRLEPKLFRALTDVRSAVNRLLPDWKAHPEESRFHSTKRTYPVLRRAYAHLSSSWAITMANEASAVLKAWDRSLRRTRQHDPEKYERMRRAVPRRHQLKASLHPHLFRWDPVSGQLDLTVRSGRHVRIDLSDTKHPRFRRYGEASKWRFGLTLRPYALLFHFHLPRCLEEPDGAVGVDLNFDSADLATSDGVLERVDLRPIARLQEHSARKRRSIQRHLSKDLRHQRAVLRRYARRETRRTTPLLHRAANQLLERAGSRALVLEDLSGATQTILQRDSRRRSPDLNRRLSAWTHGRLAEIVSYKARTPIVWVNPEGTSRECPRCGGPLALPSEGRVSDRGPQGRMSRQVVCGECGGVWHRDATAAIAVLARGWRILRGGTVPPSARNELLEAAAWRPKGSELEGVSARSGPTVEPRREDDANSATPPGVSG